MVLKACKGELNTGSTIRKGGVKSCMYGKQASIKCLSQNEPFDVECFLQEVYKHVCTTPDFKWWLWSDIEQLTTLHHDMFSRHYSGVPLSLNKDHRWLWPELLKRSIENIHCEKENAPDNEAWIFPEYSYLEENSYNAQKMVSIDGINKKMFNPTNVEENRRAAALRQNKGKRGIQRKRQLVDRSTLRKQQLLEEEDKWVDKLSDEINAYPPRPDFRYVIVRDEVPNKFMSNPELNEALEFKGRKSFGKTKGLKNKHISTRRCGLSHNEMKYPSIGALGEGKQWRKSRAYMGQMTYQKIHMIPRKPTLDDHTRTYHKTLGDFLPSKFRGEVAQVPIVPHPPPHPKEPSRPRKKRNIKHGSEERETRRRTVKTTGSRQKSNRTATKAFITEAAESSSPRLSDDRFKQLPKIVPSRDKAHNPLKVPRMTPETSVNIDTKTDVKMWEFLDVCVNQEKQDRSIQFSSCKAAPTCDSISKKPKLKHIKTQKTIDSLPNQVQTAPGKNCSDNNASDETVNNTRNKKNNYGKRRRDRIKRRKLAQETENSNAQDTTKTDASSYLLTKLKTDSALSIKLLKKYGACYKECTTSVPRKFWIDTSKRVLSDNDDQHQTARKITAVILFEKITPEKLAHKEAFTMYRIYPNADLPSDVRMECMKDLARKVKPHLIYPLRKVVEQFVDTVQGIIKAKDIVVSRDLARNHCQAQDERILGRMDWLFSLCDWQFNIHTAEEAYGSLKNCDIQRPSSAQLRKKPSDTILAEEKKKCESCSKVLVSSTSGSTFEEILQRRSITVQPCSHSFCASCFRSIVDTNVTMKETIIYCPGEMCNTVLDPVTLLWGVSLPSFNQHIKHVHDARVREHPQWQWCPRPGCGRAAKLHGSALLDCAVVIQCLCGAVWCFNCLQAGHWPATCSQVGDYHRLNAKTLEDSEDGPVSRVIVNHLCNTCSVQFGGNHLSTQALRNSINVSNECCSCQYDICMCCLNVDDPLVMVSQFHIDQKILPLDNNLVNALLPLVIYNCAKENQIKRMEWDQTKAEVKTNAIIRYIQRSRSSVRSSLGSRVALQASLPDKPSIVTRSAASHGALITAASWRGLPTSSSLPHFSPTIETEKIFLILVHHFLFQCYFLLENTHVLLMSSTKHAKAITTLGTVIKLEKCVDKIEQLLDSMTFSPSQIVLRLKKLMESGKELVSAIAACMNGLQTSHLKRMDTVMPLSRLDQENSDIHHKGVTHIRSLTKA